MTEKKVRFAKFDPEIFLPSTNVSLLSYFI
jgi:hypothetical protein